MLLTFLGANHEVTGSRTMLEWRSGHYALVDCGEEQGVDIYASAPMPVPAASVELVLLTHAHIDHTGQLPRLYRDGFRGRVLCTPETAHLCRVMLLDSAHIKETDAAYQTKKNRRSGLPPVEPDYTAEDVEGLMELFRPCRYGEVCHAADGLDVCFTDQGHLLGSSAITCRMEEDGVRRTMVFSGDVGNTGQAIIRDPQPVKEADYLMIESTYGDRLQRRSTPPPCL